jgi:hypothetical protein
MMRKPDKYFSGIYMCVYICRDEYILLCNNWLFFEDTIGPDSPVYEWKHSRDSASLFRVVLSPKLLWEWKHTNFCGGGGGGGLYFIILVRISPWTHKTEMKCCQHSPTWSNAQNNVRPTLHKIDILLPYLKHNSVTDILSVQ